MRRPVVGINMASPISACSHLLLASLFLVCSVLSASVKQTAPFKGREDTFDWRTKGVISPVTDQGQLGDVNAFVIAEGVESLLAIQTQQPVIVLSRQEVANCCDDPYHQPKYRGYDCIIHIGGLCTAETYKSPTNVCNNGTCQAVGKVTKSGYIEGNREDLMVQIIHQTPLSTYIDASHVSFQTYISGIYSEPDCSAQQLDHAVQIVGYGTESGNDYWILKNSWGATWGEQGYMRILRGKNMCGVATRVFYPINTP